jgi:hypothetical protein
LALLAAVGSFTNSRQALPFNFRNTGRFAGMQLLMMSTSFQLKYFPLRFLETSKSRFYLLMGGRFIIVSRLVASHMTCLFLGFPRSWQMNRIVLTSDTILVANVNQTKVLEMIPLPQIIDVTDVDIDPHFPLKNHDFQSLTLLQITTAVSGYNRGRIYRFRLFSESFKSCLLESIRECALSKQGALTLVERLSFVQYRIRFFFNSNPVQYLLAFLIMAVCDAPI